MAPTPAWIRPMLPALAWAGVTAIAAVATWTGLSTVYDGGSPSSHADVVVSDAADGSPTEQTPSGPGEPSKEPPPTETTEPTQTPSTTEPSEPEPINGWWPVGDGTYERTFDTEGGTAVIQLRPGEATLVSASPKRGYTAYADQYEPERIYVDFDSQERMFTVEAWWDGEPHGDVTEYWY
ncbi:MAG: hypothetical protein ACRDXX_03645 [Stackebrandtia sp.]